MGRRAREKSCSRWRSPRHGCGRSPARRGAGRNSRRWRMSVGLEQQGSRPAVVQMEMAQQDAERITHGRGMPHQFADRAESVQIEALADQQPEMVATGQRRADFQQAPNRLKRKAVVGVLKQPRDRLRLERTRLPASTLRGDKTAGMAKNRADPDIARAAWRESAWRAQGIVRFCGSVIVKSVTSPRVRTKNGRNCKVNKMSLCYICRRSSRGSVARSRGIWTQSATWIDWHQTSARNLRAQVDVGKGADVL